MTTRTIQVSFFFAMFGIVAVLAFFIFKPYLNILVLAATFAVVFYPLYQKLRKFFGEKNPGVAACATIVSVMIIVFVPLTILGTRVVSETQMLVSEINDANAHERNPLGSLPLSENPTIRSLQERAQGFLTESTADLGRFAQNLLSKVVSNLAQLFQSIAQAFLAVFLWFLAFYYFLRDGHHIKKVIVGLSPLSDKYDNEILSKVSVSMKSVIGGTLIVAIIQGVLAGIGFWIFNIPSPSIWGALTVITALIPMVGTALISIPAIGYLFVTGNTVMAIGLFIWSMLLVGGVDNIIRPKLIQRGIQVHPFIILLSVLGGISVFGPIGFLTGPIIVTLFSEFLSIYRHLVLHKEE